MNLATGEKLLTAKEVAAWLGVGVRIVYRRVKDKSLRATKVGDTKKGLRFVPDDVRAFVAACRT